MINNSEIFKKISDDYSMLLLNWAYKKTGDRNEAEDLAQEVMVQVFSSIQKEKEIHKLENFIWKIAHFVWCNYLKKVTTYRMCFSMENIGHEAIYMEDCFENLENEEEKKDMLNKIRLNISRLNYLQREIMIMFYIDGSTAKKIAEKFNISESTVKWHLFDTRKKIKKEISEMDYANFNYRPGKLHVAYSGKSGPTLDTNKINESLTKQNICLCCYKEPKTLDELSNITGIPKSYIEYDMDWLVKREFIKLEKNKYYTMFSISEYNLSAETGNIFLENKSTFSDKIIEKLMENQIKIRDIGFFGADKPMEKLLWLLIYNITNTITYTVVYDENKYPAERPVRPDGGKYFPLGFNRSEIPPHELIPYLNAKYEKIGMWDREGSMDNDCGCHWMGLYNATSNSIDRLFHNTLESKKYIDVFFKAVKDDFCIESLNSDEKSVLSEMIRDQWFIKAEDKIIPNFCVFTKNQAELLENIFNDIYIELREEVYKIFGLIENVCKKYLPKQLKQYFNYSVFMGFYCANLFTTGFAYYDGKLYDPKDGNDCAMLTFMLTIE